MGTELLTGFWLCQGYYWPQTLETWDIVPLDPSPEAFLGICHIQSQDCAGNTVKGHCRAPAPKSALLIRDGKATYSQNIYTHKSTHVDTPHM